MKPYYWIEEVKKAKGLTSDYQAGEMLGIGRQRVSHYKHDRIQSFEDETCTIIAETLGIEPISVIADQRVEGAKTPNMKAVWERVKQNIVMVPRDGIEPPTRGFSILCSTD